MCLEKFCGRVCGMHKNPVNCLLHVIAAIILIYALWQHSIEWILIAFLIAIVGHIIQAATAKKTKTAKKKKR